MRVLFPLMLLVGCQDVTNPDPINEDEVITTVELSFLGPDGTLMQRWADPENDGSPVVEGSPLAANTSYSVSVSFLNELVDPAEDITIEIEDESDQHQVFALGDLDITVDDVDANGLPVGLEWTVASGEARTVDLVVTLRHLPPLDGEPQKVAGLAQIAEDEGIDALPGETDVSVTFPITIE